MKCGASSSTANDGLAPKSGKELIDFFYATYAI
jgi:hypothetical protein